MTGDSMTLDEWKSLATAKGQEAAELRLRIFQLENEVRDREARAEFWYQELQLEIQKHRAQSGKP